MRASLRGGVNERGEQILTVFVFALGLEAFGFEAAGFGEGLAKIGDGDAELEGAIATSSGA